MGDVKFTQGKQPATYIWQDRLTDEGIERLQIQDRLITAGMGGVLPEQAEPSRFHRILDVGSGTGDWLIETAQADPTISRLIGIDISTRLVELANRQAEDQGVRERVQFQVMDALGYLNFPPDFFDLVNLRFCSSFLRTWEWSDLLNRLAQITRPGGVIRVVESDMIESNGPALNQREDLVLQALYQSGHYSTQQRDGLTSKIASLLEQQGFQHIQERVGTLHHAGNDAERQLITKYLDHGLQVLQPFVQKWAQQTQDDAKLRQQMYVEMQEPTFSALAHIHTFWGTRMKRTV